MGRTDHFQDITVAGNISLGATSTILPEFTPARIAEIRIVGESGVETIQKAINDISPTGGIVYVPSGTHTITSEIAIRSNIRLIGAGPNTLIKQGNSANLTSMINFDTHSALKSSVENLTVDGNRDNNDDATSVRLIFIGAQNDCRVENCLLQNATGLGVFLQTASRVIITKNRFTSIRESAVWISTGTGSTNSAATVTNNKFDNIGLHAIGAKLSDNNFISGNRILGVQGVGTVDTDGTTVTASTGDNFSAMLGGMIMRITQVEYQISTVNSNTSITLTSSAGSQTGADAVYGTGDLINIDSGARNVITGNSVNKGMSIGIVIHDTEGSTAATLNVIDSNIVSNAGSGGITVTSTAGGKTIDSTVISSNIISQSGQGGAANVANTGNAINIRGSESNNTIIIGNVSRDFQGTPTQDYGIYLHTDVATNTVIGVNESKGNTNAGIGNSIRALPGISGPNTMYGELIVNEDGDDIDSRIEGDTDVNLFYIDAGNDRVGISTSTPDALFHVAGAVHVDSAIELDGDLNHDGSNVGFYGTAPAAQASADAALTGTPGTADGAMATISGSGDDANINNNFQEVQDKVNAALAALRGIGLIAT